MKLLVPNPESKILLRIHHKFAKGAPELVRRKLKVSGTRKYPVIFLPDNHTVLRVVNKDLLSMFSQHSNINKASKDDIKFFNKIIKLSMI